MNTAPTTLVTGAAGCIGAWVIRQLVSQEQPVVAFDLREDVTRVALLVNADQRRRITWTTGDITDLATVERVLDEHPITSVIHLAALQAPFCRADPPRGAHVNVVGTVNLLEAIAQRNGQFAGPLVYASSIAAEGRDRGGAPETIYGVYKRACEGAADAYLRDRGVSSLGLRPHTVYGAGRDQGLTSAPTLAMLAAASGASYEIPFTGRLTMQYAPDVAAAFIAATRADHHAASVVELPGASVDIDEVVSAIHAAAPACAIVASGGPLPFATAPAPPADEPFATAVTPLSEGTRETIALFTRLLADGLLAPRPAGDPRRPGPEGGRA